jgi:hypothetical protein
MINKYMAKSGLILITFVVAVVLPVVVAAETPATGGDDTNGALSVPYVPPTGGDDTNGALSTPPAPPTGGDDTNGATPSVAPPTGGDDTNGAIPNGTTLPPPPTGGDDTNGAIPNGTTLPPPPTGGDDTNGAIPNGTTLPPPPTGGDDTNGAMGTTTYNLTVSKAGSGTGTVTGGSINCGSTCTQTGVDSGTGIVLIAVADSGSSFESWSGCTSASGATCNVTMNADIAVTVTFTANPASAPSITSSSGSSYSSGGSMISLFSPVIVGTSTPTTTPVVTACPLITTYMKFGANNDVSEVTKLQSFLKNTQELNVDVTGIFDTKTLGAVRAFQQKYLQKVMGPWGASQPSGFVYITTKNMINEIACNRAFTLSASDMAVINAYKARSNQTGATVQVGPSVEVIPSVEGTTSATTSPSENPEIGQNEDGNQNVAAVGGSNIFKRFWGFIVGLFK